MSLRIEAYAMVGDCRTAALVGRDGSIDWYCAPRFDSAACFAALLGTPDNGRWRVAPGPNVTTRSVRRRYRGDTLVLETEFTTDSGVIRLTDAMAMDSPTPTLLRLVEGVRGQVPVRSEVAIRFDYGSAVPWVRRVDGGLSAIAGPDMLRLVDNPGGDGVAVHTGQGMTSVAEFVVSEGQRVSFSLAWHPSHEPAPPGLDVRAAVERAAGWWAAWSSPCVSAFDDEGIREREALLRSLITLKGLTYAPTGGIAAAVTTSLPEHLGGVRNWDYRFCWLRDATLTLLALVNAGYLDEARSWREWLLRAVAGSPDSLQILYGLAGERRLPEYEVPWLAGYEGSKPVRVGNAASNQFQLDVYGEVADAFYQAWANGLAPLDDAWSIQRILLNFLETAWERPDEGIWEVRGPRQHFTHSKVMAWVALDRAVRSVETLGAAAEPETVKRWRALRAAVHDQVCREGFDASQNAFVQSYGSPLLDASVLMIPLVGFLPADDPRMVGTVEAIGKRLLRKGFVRRYDTGSSVDGLPPGEGAFLPCTFWYADNLALQGRRDESREVYLRLLDVRNDVGLLAEEYDPDAGRMLGNFPQAFSHICLANTARTLGRGETGSPGHAR